MPVQRAEDNLDQALMVGLRALQLLVDLDLLRGAVRARRAVAEARAPDDRADRFELGRGENLFDYVHWPLPPRDEPGPPAPARDADRWYARPGSRPAQTISVVLALAPPVPRAGQVRHGAPSTRTMPHRPPSGKPRYARCAQQRHGAIVGGNFFFQHATFAIPA